MAFLDRERGCVVVRIVYDGPPLAGKTTSLRALGAKLGREVYSAGEQDGRTLFFDWMDYIGGVFDGHLIRCQVVTVPGQAHLWPRRRELLADADSIVFVADSRADELDAAIEQLERLRGFLPTVDEPPPGVVFQANKRDADSAVPLDTLRDRLVFDEPIAVTESVASEGLGVRETFVLAVPAGLGPGSRAGRGRGADGRSPRSGFPGRALERNPYRRRRQRGRFAGATRRGSVQRRGGGGAGGRGGSSRSGCVVSRGAGGG